MISGGSRGRAFYDEDGWVKLGMQIFVYVIMGSATALIITVIFGWLIGAFEP